MQADIFRVATVLDLVRQFEGSWLLTSINSLHWQIMPHATQNEKLILKASVRGKYHWLWISWATTQKIQCSKTKSPLEEYSLRSSLGIWQIPDGDAWKLWPYHLGECTWSCGLWPAPKDRKGAGTTQSWEVTTCRTLRAPGCPAAHPADKISF